VLPFLSIFAATEGFRKLGATKPVSQLSHWQNYKIYEGACSKHLERSAGNSTEDPREIRFSQALERTGHLKFHFASEIKKARVTACQCYNKKHAEPGVMRLSLT
jgi:hypothetical protein